MISTEEDQGEPQEKTLSEVMKKKRPPPQTVDETPKRKTGTGKRPIGKCSKTR